MMKINYMHGCEIEYDEEKTCKWYSVAEEWGCDCVHCLNFLKLARNNSLPEIVLENLAFFGIPAGKATHVSYLGDIAPGQLFYQFSYRIAGNIISDENDPHYHGEVRFCHDDYPYGAPDFPQPHFDIEFNVSLPWVMDSWAE